MHRPLVLAALLASAALNSYDVRADPTAAPANGPSAADIAAKVQAFYDKTKTFQADFKQEYYIKLHDKRTTSEGQVAFEKPGKMSWTYAQPNGNRVVSDGQTLKVFEPSNQQMFV